MHISTDIEIRRALHRKKLKRLSLCRDTLVMDELGLAHAKVRVDVAVINGCVHGFEIKSAVDTLNRLPKQRILYEECLEKLTIVCAERHIRAVCELAPTWCGILEATKGARGGVGFGTIRRAQRNPRVRPEMLAHLLWRREAVELLTRLNAPQELLKKPRKQLYESLAQLLTIEQITASIREFMTARRDWRGLPTHA